MVAEAQFVTEVTPSGLEVLYQWEPKRLYKLRTCCSCGDGPDCPDEWTEVPSVTTVLGVLDKPALPWWGMGVGMEAVTRLVSLGLLRSHYDGYQHVLVCQMDGQWVVAGKPQIIDLAIRQGLTVNHVRDDAGARGTAVHDALEAWAKTGAKPEPAMYPPTEQGYVLGLRKFLDHVISAEPVASEVMVGSLLHHYAGRYDLRFKTTEEHQVVHHRTPVRGAQYATLTPGTFLLDLKTSKDVYPTSHYRQLEAYEQASLECGYEPTDGRGVLLVSDDGTYKFKRSTATLQDFLVVLATWRSDQRLKGKDV